MLINLTARKIKQTIQIDLPNGLRDVQPRTVSNITMKGTKMIGTTKFFKREYRVVWIDRLGQWRPCDEMGNYIRIEIAGVTSQCLRTRQRRQRRRQQETAVVA